MANTDTTDGDEPDHNAEVQGAAVAAVDPRIDPRREAFQALLEERDGRLLQDQEARLFIDEHGHRLRYVAAWSTWFVLDEHMIWRRDETLTVYRMIRIHLRRRRQSLPEKDRPAAAKADTVAAVERLARSDERVASRTDRFDADDHLLGMPGGEFVDLCTGVARPARAEDHVSLSTAVAASTEADCHMWRQFLGRIFDADHHVIDFAQRLVGYCLTGSTDEHMFVFAYGTGANGKSVFFNTLGDILASYAKIIPGETVVEARGERHPAEMALLDGVRLAIAQEVDPGKRWALGRIKSIASGDPITARRMRQDFYTFRSRAKLIISGNHQPSLGDVDEAIRRRMLVLPFTVTIPPAERDPTLPARLRAEWPAILRWAIDGAVAYREQGLAPPSAVTLATSEYLDEQDELAQFVAGRCTRGPDEWDTPTRLYRVWRRWAEHEGLAPGTSKRFADRLASAGYERGRDGARGRHYRGLAVATEADAEM